MLVHFVGAGPGSPDLLTVRAVRLLEEARFCLWTGSLVNPDILKLLPPDCEVHDSSSMTLEEIISMIEECSRRNVDVVRLHTGEPSIFGAIGEQMRALERLGIGYDLIPGISAFQAAASSLKVELTAPEVAQAVILARAAGRTPVPAGQELPALAATGATLCFYLSAGKVRELCDTLSAHYGPDCPAAFVYKASWDDEQVIRADLASLAHLVAKTGLDRTAIVIIGRALGPDLPSSKLYDASFTHSHRSCEPEK